MTATGSVTNGTSKSFEQKNMQLIVSANKVNETDEENGPSENSASNGMGVSLPKLSSVLNDTASPTSVNTKMLVSGKNPYKSKSGKGDVTGTILSFEMTDQNGEKLVVNNPKEPIRITIPSNGNADLFVSRVERVGIRYHKLYLGKNDSSFHMVILPECPGEFYHVYVKYTTKRVIDEVVDEKNFDWRFTVPNNMTLGLTDSDELKYSVFISNNDTKGNGTYYAGVKLASRYHI
jgi:hypothetical protein